jgi:hypothetical protein
MAKRIIAISKKYALEVGSPTPITSERQREEYLMLSDRQTSREKPNSEEETYTEA